MLFLCVIVWNDFWLKETFTLRVLKSKSSAQPKIYVQDGSMTYFCPILQSSLSNPPTLLLSAHSFHDQYEPVEPSK